MQSWKELLEQEIQKPYWGQLQSFLMERREKGKVFPLPMDVYRALLLTPLSKTRVVIIGQDPYHGYTLSSTKEIIPQAHGLAFSVKDGVPPPPSLRNILNELKNDGFTANSGDLTKWAEQGVLLLNSVLTVGQGQPASHAGHGWEQFTAQVLKTIAVEKEHVVFVRWGAYAIDATKDIKADAELSFKHEWISATHPSPLSYNNDKGQLPAFKGSKPFSKINKFLVDEFGEKPIDWNL